MGKNTTNNILLLLTNKPMTLPQTVSYYLENLLNKKLKNYYDKVSPGRNSKIDEKPANRIYTTKLLLKKIESLGHEGYIKNNLLFTMAGSPIIYDYLHDLFLTNTTLFGPMFLVKNKKFQRPTLFEKENTWYLKNNLINYPNVVSLISADAEYGKKSDELGETRYRVPYIAEKDYEIPKGKAKHAHISTNMLDSIKANIKDRKKQNLIGGILATESSFGKGIYNKPSDDGFRRGERNSPLGMMNTLLYRASPARSALNTRLGQYTDSLAYKRHGLGNYLNLDWNKIPKEKLDTIEKAFKYESYKRDTFNPTKKRGGKDYYDPEINPWKYAINYFLAGKYNPGNPDYMNQVYKNALGMSYLFNNVLE